MAECTAKRGEMWDSEILASHKWGTCNFDLVWDTFDLVMFKVILGHPVDLRFFWKDDFQNTTPTVSILFQPNLFYMLHVTVLINGMYRNFEISN